jgi:hypothetical protein
LEAIIKTISTLLIRLLWAAALVSQFFQIKTVVSRAPLDLGGSGAAQAPKIGPIKPTAEKPAQQTGSSDTSTLSTEIKTGSLRAGRITGVKTFFTKLHPGAIEFLDEQITKWLKENPDIAIKLTNATIGEIQAKKTEPNIIITVWY